MIEDENIEENVMIAEECIRKILDKSDWRDRSAFISVSAENLSDVFECFFELCNRVGGGPLLAQNISFTYDVLTKMVSFNLAEILPLSKMEMNERKLTHLLKSYYRKKR